MAFTNVQDRPEFDVPMWMVDILCANLETAAYQSAEAERSVVRLWVEHVLLSQRPDGPVCTWFPRKDEDERNG